MKREIDKEYPKWPWVDYFLQDVIFKKIPGTYMQ